MRAPGSATGKDVALRKKEMPPLAKLMLSVAIFALIFGGWLAYGHYRDATIELPDSRGNGGACALWFVGSSSIHRWGGLSYDMAPWTAHNRGINGATFDEILPRFARVESGETRPVALILYAGENDIAAGVPVRAVVRNLAAFILLRDRHLPGVPMLLLSQKPSPGRRQFRPQQSLFNDAARRLVPQFRDVYYVDATTPLLKDGQLGDNYRPDGVHMNAAGYRIWARVVRAALRRTLPADVLRRCDR
jgi:lysophospholipase L1-like esterase